MVFSEKGKEMLCKSEGVLLNRYKDSVGKWTIGVGHLITGTENPPIPDRITKERMMELLSQDIRRFEDCVNKKVQSNLEQHEFDALVHFAFNIGTGGFSKSTLLRLLNASEDKQIVAEQFMRWTKQKELTGRRKKEQKLFLRGIYA